MRSLLLGLLTVAVVAGVAEARQCKQIPSAPGVKGIEIKVNPKGSYIRSKMADPGPPTTLALESLGFASWSYVGLGGCGALDYGDAFQDDIYSMGAVFGTGNRFLAPAPYGNQRPIRSSVGDIKTDFEVPGDDIEVPVIVRAPDGAAWLKLGPIDTWYPDNTDPNRDYRVRILYPNTPLNDSRICATDRRSTADDGRYERGMEAILATLPAAAELPACVPARSRAPGQSAGEWSIASQPPVPMPEYRGWYRPTSPKPCWGPSQSAWGGRGSAHKGIDIFAPRGSSLAAPMSGLVRYSPRAVKWGDLGTVAVVSCLRGKEELHVVYGHIDQRIGANNRVVKAGVPIARSGCTGNADKAACGKWLKPAGHRTDHVHVTVFKGKVEPGVSKRYANPVRMLGWRIRSGRVP